MMEMEVEDDGEAGPSRLGYYKPVTNTLLLFARKVKGVYL